MKRRNEQVGTTRKKKKWVIPVVVAASVITVFIVACFILLAVMAKKELGFSVGRYLAADDEVSMVVMDEGFPDWGLTLSVKDVTPSGLTLVCTKDNGNPTGELMCGEDYQLITLKDGTWKTVPTVITNYGFNSMGYWISEGTDTEFEIDWEWLYGKLTAGTYRLIKSFMDFRETGDYDTATYWVEFVIE